MSPIIPALALKELSEFGIKVAMRLGGKFNDGPFHRWCEKKRKQYAEEDARKKSS
jgi:hypothetical protein